MTEPYVELHARSAFSFLQGASVPEELVAACPDLGIPAMALLDRDGVYGAPRFHMAAKKTGMRAHIGSEITCTNGKRYPLLCENRDGYQNLCRLVTRMKLRAKKGEGAATLEEIAEFAKGLICLTPGHRRNAGRHFRQAQSLRRIAAAHGPRRGSPQPGHRRKGAPPGYPAGGHQWRLLRQSAAAGSAGRAHLRARKSDAQNRRTAAHAQCGALREIRRGDGAAVRGSAGSHREHRGDFVATCNSRWRIWATNFRAIRCPKARPWTSFLRKRTDEGARQRYRPYHDKARRQIERELALIEKLNLAGYFLIVWDIVKFCRDQGILVQGRGSAANSAVCYSLGITAVDPVGMDLLFERFLSEERGEWPDIDLDLPSGDQRERVIQYVYERYGKLGAAMTANVITYRGRSAAREVGKALGFEVETLDRLSSLVRAWEWKDPNDTPERQFRDAGFDLTNPRIRKFLELYQAVQDLPRHLGQHSGGMVICQGQLDSVVPLEPATMPGRVVVQWDKEDCADMGIVKVDLLGLGMMAVLEECLVLIRESYGEEVDLAHLPADDPAVYAALQKADTIGMFQVESRAQMSCLPRLQPARFYDIVVQVAIIRPGPIVGKMVHPYLNRRQGREPADCLHPSLEPVLQRTLGVPLFQEQLLRMAMIAAGFTGGEAEELRRAMGFKRSEKRMKDIETKLREGMDRNGITRRGAGSDRAGDHFVRAVRISGIARGQLRADRLCQRVFEVPLPGGVHGGHAEQSADGILSSGDSDQGCAAARPAGAAGGCDEVGLAVHYRASVASRALCLRLGFRYVRGMRQPVAEAIVRARAERPFTSVDDLALRVPELRKDEMKMLAEVGALNPLQQIHRRDALWMAERAVRPVGPLLEQLGSGRGHIAAGAHDRRRTADVRFPRHGSDHRAASDGLPAAGDAGAGSDSGGASGARSGWPPGADCGIGDRAAAARNGERFRVSEHGRRDRCDERYHHAGDL